MEEEMTGILRQLDRLLIGGLVLAVLVIGAGFHAGARAGEEQNAAPQPTVSAAATAQECSQAVAREVGARQRAEAASRPCETTAEDLSQE
jgi:hypothetical protein